MLSNNNLQICFCLVFQDLRFHKLKNFLLLLAVTLITALYVFVFLLGSSVKGSILLTHQYTYGSTNHILYTGLTDSQADAIAQHPDIKSTVRLNTVGQLSSEAIGNRTVKLSVTEQDYAKSVLSIPTTGDFPESGGEIALDVFTMDSLGIAHELNQKIMLSWIDFNGFEQTSEFILCGWWESPTNFTEACAWITNGYAEYLSSGYNNDSTHNVTLGVMLHQPANLEIQSRLIVEDLGISVEGFTTNFAYNDVRKENANNEAVTYYIISLLVVICGFLMIYSILHVAIEQNTHYFTKLKTLGMSPRQILWMQLEHGTLLCLIGLLPGWLTGFCLHYIVTPLIISDTIQNPAVNFLSMWPFWLSALLTWGTTLLAFFVPIFKISNMTPAETLHTMQSKMSSGKPDVKARHNTIFRLALDTLRRNMKSTLLSLFSLYLAILLLCVSWISFISYDENIYMKAASPWDYSIADGSACFNLQRYNQNNICITEETIKDLQTRPEVTSVSAIKTHELKLKASTELIAAASDFYNTKEDNKITRGESMSGNPDWCAGLERLKTNGDYIGIIIGIEGIYLDYILNMYPLIDGSFDSALFDSGSYVLMAEASSQEMSTLPADSEITLGSRTFQVMASIHDGSSFINGSNSPEAEFSYRYYIPIHTFNEMFPDQKGIRQLAVNIDHTMQAEFEEYLRAYEQSLNHGLSVTMRSQHQKNFQAARITAQLTNMIIGIVLLIIGLLNFMNMLVTKTVVRKKEFAIYESLGMTVSQLKQLLLLEGLLHAALLTFILIPATFLVTWLGMPVIQFTMNTWCFTYRYCLAPLWFSIPLIVLSAVAVQLCCLRLVIRGSITERLLS